MSDDKPDSPDEDNEILTEAKKRFAFCEQWEGYTRQMWMDDYRFAHADSDNQDQWPDQLLVSRELDQKPTLTVNKTRIHDLQIVNDAKQNKTGIVVHPTSTEATYEAAEVYEDVVRHIEYMSRAQQGYDKAIEHMVFAGWGECRVITQYSREGVPENEADMNDPAFWEQDIIIKGIPDPLTVFHDPDAKEADKSDQEFAFVFDDMTKDRFRREYPNQTEAMNSTPGLYDGWITDDHIRVAEYWRRKHKIETIISIVDPETGRRRTAKKSDVSGELLRQMKLDPVWEYRERETDNVTIQCLKIAGSKIIDRYDWLGQWIPIVPAIGEEVVFQGQVDRKSHTRYLKDPQRIYNYNTSAAVETGALQTKTPWIGPAVTFESYEEYYAAANVQNVAFLPYKHRDDDGQEIPAPKRVDPPQSSPAFLQGLEIAQNEMMMASGQYQSQFGQNENATSGKAINERQRQGDNATYHFVDGAAIMVRQIGRIVVDLIPKYYDTPRILKIRGEDGSITNIQINPNAQQAVQQIEGPTEEASLIFNPNIGRYAVEVDVGPSYATKRQEAWNAMVQILTQSPQLISIVGDLLFQNGDFPGSDDIAQRLRRMVPPQALGDGPDPQTEQMQGQMQALQAAIEDLNRQLKDKSAEVNIRAFEAETKRLQAIGNAGPIVTPEQAQPLIGQVEQQMLQGGLPQTFNANQLMGQMPLQPVQQQMGVQ